MQFYPVFLTSSYKTFFKKLLNTKLLNYIIVIGYKHNKLIEIVLVKGTLYYRFSLLNIFVFLYTTIDYKTFVLWIRRVTGGLRALIIISIINNHKIVYRYFISILTLSFLKHIFQVNKTMKLHLMTL